jgi:hypothetical protein
MVAKQVWIFPVCLKGHNTPTIRSGSGSDAGALGLAAVLTECGAVVRDGVERISAGPGVGAGAELISQAEAAGLGSHVPLGLG